MRNTVRNRLLRLAEVKHLTGLGRTAIYDGIKAKTFPKPVKIGVRAVAWPESAIQGWIEQRLVEGQA